MAMEPLGGASRYSSFARSMPIGATPAQRKRQQELAEIERLQEERVSLVQRASTVTKIADIMVEQNERMLAGLRLWRGQAATHHRPRSILLRETSRM